MSKLQELRSQCYTPNIIECPYNSNKNPVINCDIIGSGYCNKKIDNILESIKGTYSNTHSNNNNGQWMSKLIKDSREILRNHFNVNDNYVVLFNGSGFTGAVNHLCHSMKVDNTWTVFITENEHNSNILPWVESGANVVVIETEPMTNLIKPESLEFYFTHYQSKNNLFACNLGNNVSGVIQDYKTIYKITRKYNVKLILDCAMVAPYILIDANYCDALAFSPHKFYGGDQTPGVLIARKELFVNPKPFCPGGGSVRMISRNFNNVNVIYSNDIETRESSGTPNILGIIKIGLIIKLKENNIDYIHSRELYLTKMIYNFMRGLDNIRIIDIPDSVDIGTFNKIIQNRIPIVSFQVLHNGVPLHYNLIVKILSDRFGILTRGGVQCCPLFAQKYLHGKSIENVQSKLLNDKGLDECYGFVRLSLNYLLTDSEIKKILEALQFISKEAYKFSGYYNYNCKSNLFS